MKLIKGKVPPTTTNSDDFDIFSIDTSSVICSRYCNRFYKCCKFGNVYYRKNLDYRSACDRAYNRSKFSLSDMNYIDCSEFSVRNIL